MDHPKKKLSPPDQPPSSDNFDRPSSSQSVLIVPIVTSGTSKDPPRSGSPAQAALKITLKQFALDLISTRIEAAKRQADEAQEAANQEEKSSAGDKYETGRAMGQLQKEMHSRQQAEHARELATLHQVDVNTLYSTAAPGALIQCPGISFFITAGLGRQQFQDETIIFLSPAAPLAKALYNKRTGDNILFNGRTLPILNIC